LSEVEKSKKKEEEDAKKADDKSNHTRKTAYVVGAFIVFFLKNLLFLSY